MAYRDEVLADSPYAYWRMGDAASPMQDETAGNRDMTVSGATLQVTGALTGDADKAASFDGVNDYGSVALNLSDTKIVTIEFWLLWDNYAANDKLAMEFTPNFNNSTGGILINPNSSAAGGTKFHVGTKESDYNNADFTRPSAGVYHHYVFVFDRTQPGADVIKVYVDGAVVSITKPQSDIQTDTFFANSTLYVMSRNAASLFGAGDIDEIAVYKTVLSATRVTAHYNAGTTSGGTAFEQAVNDTLALADAITRDAARTTAETLTLADSTANAAETSVAESLTLADSVSKEPGVPLADTLGVSDATTLQVTSAVSDILAVADSLAMLVSASRADSLALADAVDPVLTSSAANWEKTVNDTLALADLVEVGLGLALASRIDDSLSGGAAVETDRPLILVRGKPRISIGGGLYV